ncbi:MAG: redox-sensing transcriptional repressor Rex [Fibrobacterota bacterium]|nr:redox-sensing transcriptional repressor Rex [Chitinispirillaceae bacterium]
MEKIPQPVIKRICMIYQLLNEMLGSGHTTVSSSELGTRLGIGSHNVRKDISCLDGVKSGGAGYDIVNLKNAIAEKFGFAEQKAACVVGLGRIGTAFLQHAHNVKSEFRVVAGFDSNTNRIETIKTTISVYPAYQISEIAQRLTILIAILTVPDSAAQDAANRLIEGGVKGIINFTDTNLVIRRDDVFVKNMDVTGEMRMLSALIRMDKNN